MLLAWEQGTGKTVITAAAVDKLFTLKKASTCIIVVPAALTFQWVDKLQEFTDLNVHLVTRKKETRLYNPEPFSVTVISYNLFRRDLNEIMKNKWDIVVYDEAQEFSNINGVTSKLVKKFNVKVKPPYFWALTGTAIGNKLEQLYNLLYCVDKQFLPPWPIFDENHIVRNEFNVISSYKNLTSLNNLLPRRVDRKTHKDLAGQMPELVEVVHKIPATKEYKNAEKHLLSVLDDLVDNLTFDEEGNPKVAANSPVRKAFYEAWRAAISDAKIQYAYDNASRVLYESPRNKVVIFCKLKQPLYDLAERFPTNTFSFFTGDQSPEDKRASVVQFKNEGRILFCSNAGAAGLDLPWANYLYHIDVPPSHGIRDQRNKRIRRASSIHPTSVVNYLITESSLEEFFHEYVSQQSKLAAATLDGSGEDGVVMRPQSLRQFLGNL